MNTTIHKHPEQSSLMINKLVGYALSLSVGLGIALMPLQDAQAQAAMLTDPSPAIEDFEFTAGQMVNEMLPPFTGGTEMITHALAATDGSSMLPAGLTFDPATQVLEGTITDAADADNAYSATDFTYSATDDASTPVPGSVTFMITVTDPRPIVPDPVIGPITIEAGQAVNRVLPAFTGGDGAVTYALTPALPTGITFDVASRTLMGTVEDTSADNAVAATAYTYTATDSGTPAEVESVMFNIAVADGPLAIPDLPNLRFAVGSEVEVTLPEATHDTAETVITYMLTPAINTAISGLTFTASSRVIATMPDTPLAAATDGPITFTYIATDPSSNSLSDTFTIEVGGAPALEDVASSALTSLSANVAAAVSQAISSRVELALSGKSGGIDVSSSGRRFKSNAIGGDLPVRFGVWFHNASDDVADAGTTLSWTGTSDSTNLGFDVGFDATPDVKLVAGIVMNSTSNSATYRDPMGGDSAESRNSTMDLDTTAFFFGVGWNWLDAWFATGDGDTTATNPISDDMTVSIPASVSYQSIGATFAFEVIDNLNIGGKIESLTSDLSAGAVPRTLDDDTVVTDFAGVSSDTTQTRTSFILNYEIALGANGSSVIIPKLEVGSRDISHTVSGDSEAKAAGGGASETGFGVDYVNLDIGISAGLDIRSVSVDNFSSDSTQFYVRWETGDYGTGVSLQLAPTQLVDSKLDTINNGSYDQFQSLLTQREVARTDGFDLEMGYGIASGLVTVTPFAAVTNLNGNAAALSTQKVGVRFDTPSALSVELKLERAHISPVDSAFTESEKSVALTTSYVF